MYIHDVCYDMCIYMTCAMTYVYTDVCYVYKMIAKACV